MSWLWMAFVMAVAVWCVVLSWLDCTTRRLPNALTLGGAAAALAFRWAVGGGASAVDGLTGGCLAGAFLLMPFLVRAAGGGDVKMLMAAGCVSGLRGVLVMLVVVALAGFVAALLMLAFKRVDPARLRHALRSLADWRYDRRAGARALPPRDTERARVPFSIPIAAGVMVVVVGRWMASGGAGLP